MRQSFCIFLLIFLNFISENKSKHTKELRNAVLIVADDGGFEIGSYRNKICQTPNLDNLAKEGLIFNNAYASVSSCSPSRATVLTGLPSHQNGMYGLHNGINHFQSFDYIQSLSKLLKKKDIRSGIIGKKHVGPADVYPFDYSQTEENNSILQVGRNITKIKLLVREFLSDHKNSNKAFFLYIAFHDPHRCGHTYPQYGNFCEKFGNGDTGNGKIPDWNPIYYQWDQVKLPYFIQDTEMARRDISAQYTTISRLDQGVGLILKELSDGGFKDNTLVIYTSDNGIPFPNGRTNLYDPGMAIPLIISSPLDVSRKNQVTYTMTSLVDIFPTLLDWFHINYDIENNSPFSPIKLLGKSLLPILIKEPVEKNGTIFASHIHHEATMYYPMRAVRTKRYKLIHNLNYGMPFPIDQDFYLSPTFQDLLNRTRSNIPLRWSKTLDNYLIRPEWEFYNLKYDPEELKNIVNKPNEQNQLKILKEKLLKWQKTTNDPWICSPGGILEPNPDDKTSQVCMSMKY